MKQIKVAAASLNQTPLDWQHNYENIRKVIDEAREKQCKVLCLPELSVCGYGCEDSFLSQKVQEMAIELLHDIRKRTGGIVVSVGIPILYRNQLYNAAALIADRQVLGFAVKRFLAADGIHYEPRWFKAWQKDLVGEVELQGVSYPIGNLVFDFQGIRLGFEICQDAWAARRPAVDLLEHQVDMILNPSASHFAFSKFEVRKRFVLEASRAYGVSYLYANMLGNEAGRIVYDGGELIASYGELVGVGARFSYQDYSLTTAIIDVDRNRLACSFPIADADETSKENNSNYVVRGFSFDLICPSQNISSDAVKFPKWELSLSIKEEEFARAVSLGLFDYLRKSKSQGFVVSLSGGADSTVVSLLISLMTHFACSELGIGVVKQKLSHIKNLVQANTENDIVRQLLTCVYQATKNSSVTTKNAAQVIANKLGAEFIYVDIDSIVKSYTSIVSSALEKELSWECDDLALQNIQARVRAPLVWFIANLKNALLLSTSNRSEAAVGYATMDGDTCGGLSPIAGIDKAFIIKWLKLMQTSGLYDVAPIEELRFITEQKPTAELRPSNYGQTDEQDLMPYDVLDFIERQAIRDKKSPLEVYYLSFSSFQNYSSKQIAQWVKRFFTLWCQNQWKRERLAPCFHLDDENLDPKTWCRFPILSGGYKVELGKLDEVVKEIEKG